MLVLLVSLVTGSAAVVSAGIGYKIYSEHKSIQNQALADELCVSDWVDELSSDERSFEYVADAATQI